VTESSGDILFERRGAAGIVILNRPKALNALTRDMVGALDLHLKKWEADRAVTRVVLIANGERAFCAGGDIRALYDLGRAGKQQEAFGFFREEYALNTYIKRYPKPYVSLIDGMVMGGGVGISSHGSHRVAFERYAFAMPEVSIGFFPDVGGTYVLSRMPGEIGTFCALTGNRLDAADAMLSQVATHYAGGESRAELLEALCGNEPVNAILSAFIAAPGPGIVMPRRHAIDRLFAYDRVEDILAALDREAASGSTDADFAAETARNIRTKSPTSLKVALAQMRFGRNHSFEDCMRLEFRITSRMLYGHDLYEGVRAVIVDKDNKPVWQPDTLSALSEREIASYFAPLREHARLKEDELVLT
jgi:enoyl-CoA hydratase